MLSHRDGASRDNAFKTFYLETIRMVQTMLALGGYDASNPKKNFILPRSNLWLTSVPDGSRISEWEQVLGFIVDERMIKLVNYLDPQV